MRELLKRLKEKIDIITAKSNFILSSLINYPNFPHEYTLTQADNLILIIQRYSLRLFHFANNILNSLSKILDQLATPNRPSDIKLGDSFIVPIPNDIFFEFDAFIFCCKSIFEGKIIERASHLNCEAKKHFGIIAKEAFRDFIEPLLTPIRDEVTHLNTYGTAIGSIIMVNSTPDKNTFQIFSNHINKQDGGKYDLLNLFVLVLEKSISILDDLFGVFILHYYQTFGVPQRDIDFNHNGTIIKYSDFKIPGYKGIDKQ